MFRFMRMVPLITHGTPKGTASYIARVRDKPQFTGIRITRKETSGSPQSALPTLLPRWRQLPLQSKAPELQAVAPAPRDTR